MFKPFPQVTVHPDQCPHSSQAETAASVVLAIEVVKVIVVELASVVFVLVIVPTLFKHTACISVHSGNISGFPRSKSSAHVEESQVLNLSKVVECSSAAAIQSDADFINFSSGQDSGLVNTSYSPPVVLACPVVVVTVAALATLDVVVVVDASSS